MNGGFNVLKDVYKTDLYNLANGEIIITSQLKGPKKSNTKLYFKSPSAELDLIKDTDSLPPYEILDEILYCLMKKSYQLRNS